MLEQCAAYSQAILLVSSLQLVAGRTPISLPRPRVRRPGLGLAALDQLKVVVGGAIGRIQHQNRWLHQASDAGRQRIPSTMMIVITVQQVGARA